jgi:hypothetical protein
MGDIGKPLRETERPAPVRLPAPEPPASPAPERPVVAPASTRRRRADFAPAPEPPVRAGA